MEWKHIHQPRLLDYEQNIWGFVADKDDGEEVLLSDSYFSSSIVIALDEIVAFKGKKDIKEGQRVKITIETEEVDDEI